LDGDEWPPLIVDLAAKALMEASVKSTAVTVTHSPAVAASLGVVAIGTLLLEEIPARKRNLSFRGSTIPVPWLTLTSDFP